MIYRIGKNQVLQLPESGPARKLRTPRQVVPWRDVAETCRTLDAVCSKIDLEDGCKIVDGIARSGFWGAVFRDRWPNCELHLNEEDKGCQSVLEENFPNDTITSYDIHEWVADPCDIALLDFDHFTLNILDRWEDVLKAWEPICKYFIIADGACFGFKFGNLKHYGVNNDVDYYLLLNKVLRKMLGKRITVVSKFINAATILLEDVKGKGIEFLAPSEMSLIKGGKKYKASKPKKNPNKGFGLL